VGYGCEDLRFATNGREEEDSMREVSRGDEGCGGGERRKWMKQEI